MFDLTIDTFLSPLWHPITTILLLFGMGVGIKVLFLTSIARALLALIASGGWTLLSILIARHTSISIGTLLVFLPSVLGPAIVLVLLAFDQGVEPSFAKDASRRI